MAEKKMTVEAYIATLPSEHQAIVVVLRALIKAAVPEVKESIKWAQPVYEIIGPMVYIKAFTNQVNFGFWRGAELDDPDKLLGGNGERMKHTKLRHPNEINVSALSQLVRQAAKLNLELGDPTKPKKSQPNAE